MQQTDFTRFHAVMTGMAKVYEREIDGALLDAYWLCLRAWPLRDFETAAAQLMSTSRFMPRPADFHALRQAAKPLAAEAWQAALRKLGRDLDPLSARALEIATQGRYLGHIDTDELHWVQKRFVEVYDGLQDVEETRTALPELVRLPAAAAALRRLT